MSAAMAMFDVEEVDLEAGMVNFTSVDRAGGFCRISGIPAGKATQPAVHASYAPDPTALQASLGKLGCNRF